jgi:hypothetical protein
VVEPGSAGCRWSRPPYRRAFLRQHLFGEPRLIARTQWQYRVAEVIMRVVQYSSALGVAVANPDIGPGLPLEETGEIFSTHAGRQVAPDIALADERCRGGCPNLGFGRGVDGQRIAPLGSDAATQSS